MPSRSLTLLDTFHVIRLSRHARPSSLTASQPGTVRAFLESSAETVVLPFDYYKVLQVQRHLPSITLVSSLQSNVVSLVGFFFTSLSRCEQSMSSVSLVFLLGE
jgi:hypothetical protein